MEESNKRRATQAAKRLRDLAEDKFKDGDTNGARKMALKAQVIFPSFPGLSRMIAAFEIHITAATRKLSTGKVDCYAVLGMSETHTVDANIIKKQLKKMCLLTHPDKNCSAAWRLQTGAGSGGVSQVIVGAANVALTISSCYSGEVDSLAMWLFQWRGCRSLILWRCGCVLSHVAFSVAFFVASSLAMYDVSRDREH